jgi:thiol-disulfide isomerase/thioredoxin
MKKLILLIFTFFTVTLSVFTEEVNKEKLENPILFQSLEHSIELAKEKPTVLFFKADWCPSCTAAAKNFEKNKDLLKDVNLIVVNYDKSGDLQIKYGVTYQHTFVQISPTGEALVKWNGGSTDKLLSTIKGDVK